MPVSSDNRRLPGARSRGHPGSRAMHAIRKTNGFWCRGYSEYPHLFGVVHDCIRVFARHDAVPSVADDADGAVGTYVGDR